MSDISRLLKKYSNSFSEEELHEQIVTKTNSWGIEIVFAALLLYHVMRADTTSVKDKAVIAAFLCYLVVVHGVLPMSLFIGLTREMLEYLGVTYAAVPAIVKDNLSPAIIADVKSSLRSISTFEQISDEEIIRIMAKWNLKELDIDF